MREGEGKERRKLDDKYKENREIKTGQITVYTKRGRDRMLKKWRKIMYMYE